MHTIYCFRLVDIDGAYFGTTFPHLLLQTYPDLQPPSAEPKYIPRIYGFKIHPTARQRQQEYAKQRAKAQQQQQLQQQQQQMQQQQQQQQQQQMQAAARAKPQVVQNAVPVDKRR
jgi:hypothetical protein